MDSKTFLLISETTLWERFTSRIPRNKSINQQLNDLMEKFANED